MRYIIGTIVGTIGASDAVLDILGYNPSLLAAILMVGGGAVLALTGKDKSTGVILRDQ